METLSTNRAAHSVANKSVFNAFFALFLKVPQCVFNKRRKKGSFFGFFFLKNKSELFNLF